MLAIFKREFKSYFQTVVGWLFLAVLLALYGLYYYVYNLRSGSPYISYSLSGIIFIMLITVPVLTMRSLAEDRHNKTDQLILTAPLSVGKIVFGKYLAMAAVFTLDVVIIALTPLILSVYGTVAMGESYTAIFGFWLYGCACIAIGMFLSSLTESQVISAVLTFAVLFLGYMMNSITGVISETGNILTSVLNCYDLYTPVTNFMNGCLDVSGAVYFISLIVLMLFLSVQSIQKRRWSISTKKIGTGVFSIGFIAIVLAVVVVINLLVNELPSNITAIDATTSKLYSVTDDTKEYLSKLDQDVAIYVLADEDDADTTLAETLKRYEALSGHITVSYKDPADTPTFYQQYTDSSPSANSLIVVGEQRSRVVDYRDIYEYSYDYYSYSSSVSGYDAEGQLTSAIQYVTMEASELPVIYEIEGHGETSLSGSFAEVIEKANINLSSLTLLTEDAVPEDAQAIIINGPTSDFSEDDAQKVIAYLKNGGNVMINCNLQYQELPNLESILSEFGMERVNGVVMENNSAYYYQGTPYFLLPEVASTSYTSSVAGSYIFAPYSQAVSYGEDTDEITYTPLLTTSDSSVSKTDMENVTTTELEDGDIAGPFALAVAMQYQTDDDTTATMLVSGSMSMYTDEADQIVSGNNSAMFTNMISEITDDSDLVFSVIPVKEYSLSTITVATGAAIMLGLGLMIFVPVILLVIGIVIWAARRKR